MSLEISKEVIDETDEPQVQLKIDEDEDDVDEVEIEEEEDDENVSDSEGMMEQDDDDDADDDDDDDDDDDEKSVAQKKQPQTSSIPSSLSEMLQNVAVSPAQKVNISEIEELGLSTDDEMGEIDEDYLQKFTNHDRDDYILNFHPEQKIHNYNEVEKMSKVSRDKDGNITDPFHKTTPIMSRYEKTKVLGQRAKQIDSGCSVFVNVPSNVLDGYLIAMEELKQKKLPFIIRRPIPNGGVEYWPVRELDIVN